MKLGDGSGDTFNADEWMLPKEQRRVDNFILFGVAAAIQAVRDSGWEEPGEEECLRTGVMIGAGIGGLRWISDTSIVLHERGVRKVSHTLLRAPSSTWPLATCPSSMASKVRIMRQ